MPRLVVAMLSVLVLGACTSPEATRVRAGGSGADVGNVREPVRMHAGSEPYWETPRLVQQGHATPAASPGLAPAEPAGQDARQRR